MTRLIGELKIKEFNVTTNIITDQDIIMWESMGLTADVQSMENAALLSQVFPVKYFQSHTNGPSSFDFHLDVEAAIQCCTNTIIVRSHRQCTCLAQQIFK